MKLRSYALELRRALTVATAPAPAVAYVGHAGLRNLGDDAILAALVEGLTPIPLVSTPIGNRSLDMARRLRRLTSRAPVRAVLLGGGTLVGRFGWLERLQRTRQLLGDPPAVTLGVGVEDPRGARAGDLTSHRELQRWAEVLESLELVTVRGPHSAALLAGLGIEAPVVADPALRLGHHLGPRKAPGRRLGLVVGPAPRDSTDRSRLVDAVATFLSEAQAEGWRARFLLFHPRDRELTREVFQRGGGNIPVHASWRDLESTLQELQHCDAVVSQRLHGAVLAIAAGTPAIMIAYHPKCWDFMASLEVEDFAVDPSTLEAPELLARLGEIGARGEALRDHLRERSQRLVAALDHHLARAREIFAR